MIDIIQDALLDTAKLIPYLFITFIIIELIEHKLNNEKILKKSNKFGPIIGGILGALPQCGISTMASNLYTNKVITIGTLIAIFLSTSDEMLPMMISRSTDIKTILSIVLVKVIIGIILGLIIDKIYKRKEEKVEKIIHNHCDEEHCHCEEEGIFLSSFTHTVKIALFILVINLILDGIIYLIGEETLKNILINKNILVYFLSSLIGLIPNCASSIVITELYLQNMITIGTLFSGLLTGSGLGLLILFKTNKNLKENISILTTIYLIGVIVGFIIDIII